VGAAEINFDEPMDAMLWFLEAVPAFTKRRSYPKASLKKLIIRWYGEESTRNFERLYKQLRDKGFIHSEQNPANRRAHNVKLTRTGRRLLNQVKAERAADTALFTAELLKLPKADREVVLSWLNTIAKAGLIQMIEEASAVASRQRDSR